MNSSLFYYYFLITVLFSTQTTITLLLPHPVYDKCIKDSYLKFHIVSFAASFNFEKNAIILPIDYSFIWFKINDGQTCELSR